MDSASLQGFLWTQFQVSRGPISHGVGATPLLGQTIGDNLRASTERHGDRDALVVCWQIIAPRTASYGKW